MTTGSGRRVGLLFGGRSTEHEVSVVSARGVAAAMADTELTCVPIAVTRDGRWLSDDVSAALLASAATEVAEGHDGPTLAVVPGCRSLLRLAPDRREAGPLEVDVVFPLIHGWGGEDGRLQGLLDLAGIPYVGAGVLGSAVGMDKAVARTLFEGAGLATAPWRLVTSFDDEDRPTLVRAILERPGMPCFVKPANGGSSVGISRVADETGLSTALDLAFRHDRRVVVEQALDAREVECAVLGNERPRASGLGEIRPSRAFYDYEAKYVDGTSELLIPAPLDAEATEAIRRQAVAAYRALDLRGFARVDFLVDRRTGVAFLNEVNTLPGFTPISMFPKLWEAAGLPYPRLIEALVSAAFEAPPPPRA